MKIIFYLLIVVSWSMGTHAMHIMQNSSADEALAGPGECALFFLRSDNVFKEQICVPSKAILRYLKSSECDENSNILSDTPLVLSQRDTKEKKSTTGKTLLHQLQCLKKVENKNNECSDDSLSLTQLKPNEYIIFFFSADISVKNIWFIMKNLSLRYKVDLFMCPRFAFYDIRSLDELYCFVTGSYASSYLEGDYTINWWLKQKNERGLTILSILEKLDSPEAEQLTVFLRIVNQNTCSNRERLAVGIKAAQYALGRGVFWTTFLGTLSKAVKDPLSNQSEIKSDIILLEK